MQGATGAARSIAALLLALALGLAGCNDAPASEERGPPPSPLLYEIASSDGAVEGWMVGTIHALPPGTRWRSPAIAAAAEAADLLVVEIADLDGSAAVFAALSASAQPLPLDQRIPADMRPGLAALIARGGMSADSLSGRTTWAAALMLARIGAEGDPANGVDRALIREFEGRPVRELEGARGQLTIFDRLPEADQRSLLGAVISGADRASDDAGRLRRAWLQGDADTLAEATRSGILSDPALREALLVSRNRAWAAAIIPMLEDPDRPLIAVGGAHLVGSDGLAAILAQSGYRIRPLR
jgi:uncharacterized protein